MVSPIAPSPKIEEEANEPEEEPNQSEEVNEAEEVKEGNPEDGQPSDPTDSLADELKDRDPEVLNLDIEESQHSMTEEFIDEDVPSMHVSGSQMQ